MVKAVIFDLFNTLIDQRDENFETAPKITDIIDLSPDVFHKEFALSRVDRHLGKLRDRYEIYQSIAEKYNKSVNTFELDLFDKYWNKKKETAFKNLNKRILELLQKLNDMNIRVAIITNCEYEDIKYIKKSEINDYAEFIIYSPIAEMVKPDREIYELALNKLGLKSEECIYIGDGDCNELEGSTTAGLKSYQAFWFLKEYEKEFLIDKYKPFPRLTDPNEVLGLLN